MRLKTMLVLNGNPPKDIKKSLQKILNAGIDSTGLYEDFNLEVRTVIKYEI